MKEVIKFESKWCVPCKTIQPLMDKLAVKYDNITFGKIDVEVDAESTTRFKVRSVPTIVFLNDGQLFNQIVGNVAEETLRDAVRQLAEA